QPLSHLSKPSAGESPAAWSYVAKGPVPNKRRIGAQPLRPCGLERTVTLGRVCTPPCPRRGPATTGQCGFTVATPPGRPSRAWAAVHPLPGRGKPRGTPGSFRQEGSHRLGAGALEHDGDGGAAGRGRVLEDHLVAGNRVGALLRGADPVGEGRPLDLHRDGVV